MKIKAKNPRLIKSMKLNVPIDGIIEIDENGVAEVSSKCGQMLIEGTNDWKEFGEKKVSNEEETNAGAGEKDENADISDEEVIEGIKQMSLDDCVALAKQSGYPEKEWEKFAKNEKAAEKLMRQYLIKKFSK